jgi:hypothetical protein
MKQVMKVAAFALALSLGGAAFAAEAPAPTPGGDAPKAAPKHAGRGGKVKSVSAKKLVLTDRSGADVEVDIDEATKVTKDGEPATIADVTAGERVTVTPDTGTATEVQIHTKAKAKKGGDAAAKPSEAK